MVAEDRSPGLWPTVLESVSSHVLLGSEPGHSQSVPRSLAAAPHFLEAVAVAVPALVDPSGLRPEAAVVCPLRVVPHPAAELPTVCLRGWVALWPPCHGYCPVVPLQQGGCRV